MVHSSTIRQLFHWVWAGLLAIALLTGCGDRLTANSGGSSSAAAQPLPIESIQPANSTVAQSEDIALTVTVGLPNGCYRLVDLRTDVDASRKVLTVTATGTREGDFCTEIYRTQDETLMVSPLPEPGEWTFIGQRFDEQVKTQVTVEAASE